MSELLSLGYNETVRVSGPTVEFNVGRRTTKLHGWGGWSDPRDSMLCFLMSERRTVSPRDNKVLVPS